MNAARQQEVCETEFGGSSLRKEKRIIYFSSGETLELEDPEEDEAEEQPSSRNPFEEPGGTAKISFKNVALLVGRMSLLACDFLGERLAGALGLNAAKYQYAIDQYHREHKATDEGPEEQAENVQLSPALDGSHYGAMGDVNGPSDLRESCDDKHGDKGCQNGAYQGDEDN